MIIGHTTIVAYLSKCIERKRFSHAYLFDGPEGVGKTAVSHYFVKLLHCTERKGCGLCDNCRELDKGIFPEHTTVTLKEGASEIGIKEVRQLLKFVAFTSARSQYKSVIIEKADWLTEEAVNALLKILEEPRGDTVFILISDFGKGLPQTILSRVEHVRFGVVKPPLITEGLLARGYGKKETEDAVRYGVRRPGFALRYIENKDRVNEDHQNLIHLVTIVKEQSLDERFREVLSLLEDTKRRKTFLMTFSFFLRDLLLSHEGVDAHYMSAYFSKNDLSKMKDRYTPEELLTLLRIVRDTEFMLAHTNVSPRLALEVLMLHI